MHCFSMVSYYARILLSLSLTDSVFYYTSIIITFFFEAAELNPSRACVGSSSAIVDRRPRREGAHVSDMPESLAFQRCLQFMGVSENYRGTLFWGPYHKDPTI